MASGMFLAAITYSLLQCYYTIQFVITQYSLTKIFGGDRLGMFLAVFYHIFLITVLLHNTVTKINGYDQWQKASGCFKKGSQVFHHLEQPYRVQRWSRFVNRTFLRWDMEFRNGVFSEWRHGFRPPSYCLPHSIPHLHIESRENLWCSFSVVVDLDLVLVRTYVRTDVRTNGRVTHRDGSGLWPRHLKK